MHGKRSSPNLLALLYMLTPKTEPNHQPGAHILDLLFEQNYSTSRVQMLGLAIDLCLYDVIVVLLTSSNGDGDSTSGAAWLDLVNAIPNIVAREPKGKLSAKLLRYGATACLEVNLACNAPTFSIPNSIRPPRHWESEDEEVLAEDEDWDSEDEEVIHPWFIPPTSAGADVQDRICLIRLSPIGLQWLRLLLAKPASGGHLLMDLLEPSEIIIALRGIVEPIDLKEFEAHQTTRNVPAGRFLPSGQESQLRGKTPQPALEPLLPIAAIK